ncbi:Scp160p KNAG_0B01930 [Huiozyma naganishii CBS 8797]|uniref:K Homology domain-containing protein n=1 Tax=Huiozyma naganishii (strain ATCC MYA-139 / BCRC 22969 / CBS 8797 / KCTC 17520 / NBRC 10181 / NCYC 3082 / Yp74L-3) TaxID=1071383 RepID=J7R1E9_HUIN7|nr:hypothetical protein KNAG_0B01930 [Kazachstania naganishii CBS 8797]CCK68635.1 hypothetical protein KNAG_0B01930 [Kazachstania naganishii CBS 8797]
MSLNEDLGIHTPLLDSATSLNDLIAGVEKKPVANKENKTPTPSPTPSRSNKPLPSLKDLPSLVSKDTFANTKVEWGPNMKPAPFVSAKHGSGSSKGSNGSNATRMKSRNIQETFTLDLQSQLAISKPELSKIMLSVKQNFNVSVESTLSKNSRTFLISGVAENVRSAKRELVKKLTKPITATFVVPTKCKAAIIGAAGKTIREISSKFDVRIDVSREENQDFYDEDLDDTTSDVTLFGDFESVNLAKQRILDIVKEETKHAVMTVKVDNESLLPFVDPENFPDLAADVQCRYHATSGDIVLSGLREEVQDAKTKVQKYLEKLALDLTEQKVKIPTKFQFLIDAAELKEKFNVTVTFPTENDDEFVTFAGEEDKVKDAIAYARSSSKQFSVDTLDIAKSHSKNLDHAKNLILYFTKYPVLQSLQKSHPNIKLCLPTPAELSKSEKEVNIKISARTEESGDLKTVRKELIGLVNAITPADTLTITDLDYELFHKSIFHTLSTTEPDVPFVQLGDYFLNRDEVVLYAPSSTDDFKPSPEEIKENLEKVSSNLDPLRAKLQSMDTKVFDFAAENQDSLFSDGKVTYILLSKAIASGNDHMQIKLHTPTADQMTIRGDANAVKHGSKIIGEIIENPSNESKATIEVPSNVISRLIGNKGSHVQQLRERFDCQIDIPSSNDNDEKTPVEITLTGQQFNISCAKKEIAADAKKLADTITKELLVPIKLHRSMIGPNNVYRNKLQEKYGVSIYFPRDSEVVTIRGPSRGVKQAYEELSSLLDFERENGHKVQVPVPAEHVPRIIGKNGDNINDLRAEFGVELDFLRKAGDEKANDTGAIDLEITGTRTAIKEAAARVEQIIAEVSDFTTATLDVDHEYLRAIIGTRGVTLRDIISKSGGDEIRGKSVDIPNANSESNTITVQGPKDFVDKVISAIKKIVEVAEKSETKELDIPKDRHGALVGPSGSIRRNLESEFNVIIRIPNRDEEGPVTITGLPEDIAKAEKEVFEKILKDDFDVEIEVPASVHEFVSERGAIIQRLRLDEFVNVKHGNTSRRAQQINRRQTAIPTERVLPANDEEKSKNIKVVVEEVGAAQDESLEGIISWRLTYEPIDLTGILDDDGTNDESGKEKKNNAESESKNSAKKAAALEKASAIITDRISKAAEATYAGYIWTSDPKKFNKVVGPGGSNLTRIRTATGVIINVPRKNDKVNDVVYIRGSKEGVEAAIERVTKSLK